MLMIDFSIINEVLLSIYNFIFDNLDKITIIILIMYKIIDYLSKKIEIEKYSYQGNDNSSNDVKIICFNLKDISNDGYKNLYYRFKVDINYFNNNKPPLNNHILILNRNEIEFFDKIKFIKWMLKEHLLNKICKNRDKKLPYFLVRIYIFPNTIFN